MDAKKKFLVSKSFKIVDQGICGVLPFLSKREAHRSLTDKEKKALGFCLWLVQGREWGRG